MNGMFTFACPRCLGDLESVESGVLRCSRDEMEYECRDGIWRFILPERMSHFEPFVKDYESIRRQEGRGAESPEYYRALPYRDLSGKRSADWRIRAASSRVLLKQVVAPMEARLKRALQILELGAGNGWLSNRLSQRGHQVAALDLAVNDFDGLGCYRFYESRFTLLQAEFDRIPFRLESVDMVIYNASFHYSEDYHQTLAQGLRVMRQDGFVVILDTPVYHQSRSGAQMVQERQSAFLQAYGLRSDALHSENYLTYEQLGLVGKRLQMQWKILTPFYGFRWVFRPFLARILGRREPAKFHVIVGRTSPNDRPITPL